MQTFSGINLFFFYLLVATKLFQFLCRIGSFLYKIEDANRTEELFMNRTHSEQIFAEEEKHIVGGVNSPSRSYRAVGGGAPTVMERAEGAYFWDVDGNRYIDYLAAYGPIVTGHAHPHITKAITHAARSEERRVGKECRCYDSTE